MRPTDDAVAVSGTGPEVSEGAALSVLLLPVRLHYTRVLLDQEVAALRRGDPCASVDEGFGDLETARRVTARYNIAGACAEP